jgi:hypothetical protein
MSPKNIFAVILIALGVVVLGYSGITYTTGGDSVDLLGVHVEITQSHNIPPVAGVIALVAGIALLVVNTKRD